MPGATYCGAPPLPGELLDRFKLDPVVIACLVALTVLQVWHTRSKGDSPWAPLAGWAIAAAAFLSPLCALSVSLFAARVGQHMILILIAAPLIASALPGWQWRGSRASLWSATAAFFVLLWFWHMPVPYGWTFLSTPVYWTMHVTLFGSAIWLWSELIGHRKEATPAVLAAGTLASVQMGLLGAVITLAGTPMYAPHFMTTIAWGLTPLEDQQFGGVLMWVPGIVFFLCAALASLAILWRGLEARAA